MHWLMIVAQLCQYNVPTDSGRTHAAVRQAQCQAFYVECVRTRPASIRPEEMLESCILKRLDEHNKEQGK